MGGAVIVEGALCPSPGRDPQGLLHILVDHIGDAHSRDNLHEVGGDAPVETPHALLGQDVAEQTQHGELGAALDGGWEGLGRPGKARGPPLTSPSCPQGLGQVAIAAEGGGLDKQWDLPLSQDVYQPWTGSPVLPQS